MRKDLPLDRPHEKQDGNLLRLALFSAGFGAVFGILASLTYYLLNNPFGSHPLFYLGIPLMSALISGAAGVGGFYLDKLFIGWGIGNRAFRQIIIFLLLASITQGGAIWLTTRLGRSGWERQFLWGGASGCLFGAFISIIEYRYSRIREKMLKLELENKYLAEIAAKDRQLQETAKNLAVAEERNRMARELHDSISQGIHGIVFAVNSLKQGLPADNERLHNIAALLEETANATLNELRAMVLELKPSLFDERGFGEAVKLQGELFAKRHRVEVDWQLEKISGLSSAQEMALYRIFQEALTNIGRHSGAGKVEVRLQNVPPAQVILTIHDDGKGFDAAAVARGNGLHNMAARSREADGEFHLGTEPGKGTKIEVVMAITQKTAFDENMDQKRDFF